jgi:hypothetical protein
LIISTIISIIETVVVIIRITTKAYGNKAVWNYPVSWPIHKIGSVAINISIIMIVITIIIVMITAIIIIVAHYRSLPAVTIS